MTLRFRTVSVSPKIKMRISAIDIGSNSVRLGTTAGGKTLYKRIATTRLGEGLSLTGVIKPEALERSAVQVADFYAAALSEGADKVYAFATAAVRSAANGADFVRRVKELCGLEVEVIDGRVEAEIGMLGAVGKCDGGMIDIGGASTEVTVRSGGKTVYSQSVNIGVVRLFDLAGRDRRKIEKIAAEKLAEFAPFSAKLHHMRGVSGTATTLAALKHGLREYDAEVVQGTVLTLEEVENYADELLKTPVEEICKMLTVDSRRADIIGGGAALLHALMKRFEISQITVSDSDNLEGYILLKEGAL